MSFYRTSQQMMSTSSVSGGKTGGGYGQCGVGGMDGGYGQVGGGFGQVGGGYGQGGGGYGQGGGGYSQVGGGFGQGMGQGAGGFGYGAGGGAGGGFGGGADAGAGYGGGDSLFNTNGKQTMQDLNSRFAVYLGRVRTLEASNVEIEKKIKDFLEKQKSGSTTGEPGKDYSAFFKTIEDLKAKIIAASNVNNATVLQIDNARLAYDDFKMKYENELALRKTVEADIGGLRKILDDLTMTKSDLQSQLESLLEEIAALKKNREDETKGSQTTTVGGVNVEMNAAPSNDLLKTLNDMRAEYEAMAEKNRKDAENQFKAMTEGLKKDIVAVQEEEKTSKTEISELRKTLQALEIELQAQLSMKKSLEETLAQTEGQFCVKLSHIQTRISAIEDQLTQIRDEISCQTSQYEDLLNVKSKLEAEIGTYQKLLDESNSTGQTSSGQASSTTSTGTSGSTSSQGPRRR